MVRKKNKDNKKDVYTVVMVIQTILGGLLILAMLLSYKNQGSFLSSVTEMYRRYMDTDFVTQDISSVFGKLSEKNGNDTRKTDNTETASPDSDIPAAGGKDIEFSSLEALEGLSFENIETGVDMKYPLDDFCITSVFGYRTGPLTNEPGIHTGLDMAAVYGSPVYAAADGEVLDAAWDDSYGNYIKLLHKNNTVSIYAHCSDLCVNEGESVEQGEKIAEVGSTGASTGNHLHFEVRKDNIRINPEFLLDEKE